MDPYTEPSVMAQLGGYAALVIFIVLSTGVVALLTSPTITARRRRNARHRAIRRSYARRIIR